LRGAIAPCFEHTATIAIHTLEKGAVADELDIILFSDRALDRVRLLTDQEVDTLICGGVQNRLEDMIEAAGIQVISWVSGSVNEVLERFARGRLISERD